MNERKETNRICFHHSLSKPTTTAAEIRTWHMQERNFSDIAYHFVIQGDGKIEKGRPIDLVGAHNLGHNEDSVGVCFCGNFNQSDPTMFQYKSGAALYVDICKKYGKELKVDFHRVQPNPCPGRRFNRERFKADCKAEYERYLAELPKPEPVQPPKKEETVAYTTKENAEGTSRKGLLGIAATIVTATICANTGIDNTIDAMTKQPGTGILVIGTSVLPILNYLKGLIKHKFGLHIPSRFVW